jgi:hypothetical protein
MEGDEVLPQVGDESTAETARNTGGSVFLSVVTAVSDVQVPNNVEIANFQESRCKTKIACTQDLPQYIFHFYKKL